MNHGERGNFDSNQTTPLRKGDSSDKEFLMRTFGRCLSES